MREPIDHHPERRAAQIAAARAALIAPRDAAELHWACEVLRSLSRDPLDHLLADQFSDRHRD